MAVSSRAQKSSELVMRETEAAAAVILFEGT